MSIIVHVYDCAYAASTYIRQALNTPSFGEAGQVTEGGSIRVAELTWGHEFWNQSPLSKEVRARVTESEQVCVCVFVCVCVRVCMCVCA